MHLMSIPPFAPPGGARIVAQHPVGARDSSFGAGKSNVRASQPTDVFSRQKSWRKGENEPNWQRGPQRRSGRKSRAAHHGPPRPVGRIWPEDQPPWRLSLAEVRRDDRASGQTRPEAVDAAVVEFPLPSQVSMPRRLRNAKEPGRSADIARRLQATGRRCLRPSPVRLTHRARARASAARPAAFPSRSGAIRKSRRAADVLHRPSNRLLGLDRLFIRGVRPEPRSLDPRGRLGHRRTRTKYRFGAIAGGQPVSKVGPDAK